MLVIEQKKNLEAIFILSFCGEKILNNILIPDNMYLVDLPKP